MTVELNDTDLRILNILQAGGRATATQIGDEVGLSRPAVADRLEKLERQGVIRGYTVVVDPGALGQVVTAFISARGSAHLHANLKKSFRSIVRSVEVVEAHTVAGDDCYLIKVRTGSIASLNAFVSRLTGPPLSLSTKTTIVMQTHFERVGGIILSEEPV